MKLYFKITLDLSGYSNPPDVDVVNLPNPLTLKPTVDYGEQRLLEKSKYFFKKKSQVKKYSEASFIPSIFA